MYRAAIEDLYRWKESKRQPKRTRNLSMVLCVKEDGQRNMKRQLCGFVTADWYTRGIYYYTNDRGSCEVDFILDTGEQIVPVEVKAEVNLKAKSLKTYREKFAPEISVRTSMADYRKEDWLVNLPLYAVEEICKWDAGIVKTQKGTGS